MSGERGAASDTSEGLVAAEVGPVRGALISPIGTCLVAALLSLLFSAQWWARAVGEDGGGYAVYLVGGLHASSVLEGEVFRIVTAPLLHLHFHHLVANLAGLLAFGSVLESQIGHVRFLLVTALAMIAGSMASVALPPQAGVLVGASGAVFGMIGAMAALTIRAWQAPSPLLRRTRWVLPAALMGDAVLALAFPGRIAWIAHLGGFAGGMVVMAVLARAAGPVPLAESSRGLRVAAVGLATLFLSGITIDVARIASGRVCEVLQRSDLSAAVRAGFSEALRDLPVNCAGLAPAVTPPARANSAMRARPRTRSSANRRGP